MLDLLLTVSGVAVLAWAFNYVFPVTRADGSWSRRLWLGGGKATVFAVLVVIFGLAKALQAIYGFSLWVSSNPEVVLATLGCCVAGLLVWAGVAIWYKLYQKIPPMTDERLTEVRAIGNVVAEQHFIAEQNTPLP